MNWKPIEGAPRDGRWVTVGTPATCGEMLFMWCETCRWKRIGRQKGDWISKSGKRFLDGSRKPTVWDGNWETYPIRQDNGTITGPACL